ncbi:hypothetical protein PAF17_15310 [Paracoccus sp. Z330]|uniref:DUF4870 domain-containing protein n=1 Tax=Paracoccus onchidii TaxID=3017813 RepID=A0ABT4ZHS3_9RHOB|nr:hypothetical protein [Paracoccus onchidii]MDB6178863.1 hypothetical protein [Paracoccus onchidii]
MTLPKSSGQPDMTQAKIIYGLFAIGYILVVTALAGVVYAYLSRGRDAVLDSHLTFQIRTFWISLGIGMLALITSVIGIGFLIWAFLAVWGAIRVISGFLLANEGKPLSGTRHWGMMAY